MLITNKMSKLWGSIVLNSSFQPRSGFTAATVCSRSVDKAIFNTQRRVCLAWQRAPKRQDGGKLLNMGHKICALDSHSSQNSSWKSYLQLTARKTTKKKTNPKQIKKVLPKAMEHICDRPSLIHNQFRNDKPVLSERPQSSYLFDISNQVIQRVRWTMSLRKRRNKKEKYNTKTWNSAVILSKVVQSSIL